MIRKAVLTTSLGVVVALLVAGCPGVTSLEDDSGRAGSSSGSSSSGGSSGSGSSSAGSATRLAVGESRSDEISPAGDTDDYIFSVHQGTTYVIQTSGDTDTTLTLYFGTGSSSVAFDDDDGDGRNARIEWRATASGECRVRVAHFSSSGTGSYRISVSTSSGASGSSGGSGGSSGGSWGGSSGGGSGGGGTRFSDLPTGSYTSFFDVNVYVYVDDVLVETEEVSSSVAFSIDSEGRPLKNGRIVDSTSSWSSGGFNFDVYAVTSSGDAVTIYYHIEIPGEGYSGEGWERFSRSSYSDRLRITSGYEVTASTPSGEVVRQVGSGQGWAYR